MKKIVFYEQGDIVEVVDKEQRYCTYSNLFKFCGYDQQHFYDTKNLLFKELKKNHLYKVLKQVSHENGHMNQILFIQDKSGYIYAIGIEGVRIHKELLWG